MTSDQFAGNPMGWDVEVSLDGNHSFANIQNLTTRNSSVVVTRAGAEEPTNLNLPLWHQGGGFPSQPVVPDFAKIHLWDPYMFPGGLYVRYFNGFVLNQRPNIDGNANEGTVLECIGVDWLLDNPPARPTTILSVGMAPQWLKGHTYVLNDVISAFPDNGHQFKCTTPGTTDPNNQPTFNLGAGATTADGTLVWTEFGNSAISDSAVWSTLLPIYFPNGEITYGGANQHTIIASVPSFQVDPTMTPRDVAKKLLTYGANRGYYATYPTWIASHVYTPGDLMEVVPSTNGIIFQVQSVTGDAKSSVLASEPSFSTVLGPGGTIVDNHVTWVGLRRTGRWEASTFFIMGQRIEPQTGALNGLWYQVIAQGVTAANPPGVSGNPPWPTLVGNTVINGGVTLKCMGATAAAPVMQLWTPSDNVGHTASWTPDFAWFDSNDPTQIASITAAVYTDQNPQTNVHVHFSDITLNREGVNDFANRWYVLGKNNAIAVVNDTTSQTTLGMTVSRTFSDTSDTGPSNESECADRGQQLLAVSIVRETVQLTAPDVTDPVMIQRLATNQITASLLGLGSQTYPITAVSVTLSNAAPKWDITFGAGFLSDRQDPYSNVRSSRRYGSDITPPDLVTWPTGFVAGNSVDPQSLLVTATVAFVEDSADTQYFFGYYTLNSDGGHWFANVNYPTTNITIRGLPRNQTVIFYVAARDHNGNVKKDSNGNVIYSASPSFVTAQIPSAPPAPVITFPTDYSSVQYGPNSYYLLVTVHKLHPDPGPPTPDDATNGGWVHVFRTNNAGGDSWFHIPAGSGFPFTALLSGYQLGDSVYAVAWIIDAYNQAGAISAAGTHYVIPAGSGPPTPNITGVVYGDQGGGFAYADVTVNKASVGDDGSGLGRIVGKPVGFPNIEITIPRGSTFPYTGRLYGLQTGETLSIDAAIANQFDILSAYRTFGPVTVPSVAPHAPQAPAAGTQGHNNFGYFVPITVSKFAGGDDAAGGGWVKYTLAGVEQPPVRIPSGSIFPYTLLVGSLLGGVTYTFRATIIDTQETESLDSPTTSVPITVVLPHAPVITNPIAFRRGLTGYIATPVISKFAGGDDASGGGYIVWTAGTDGITGNPPHVEVIPAGSAFPYTGNDPIDSFVTYTFVAYIRDGSGQLSAASPGVTIRVGNPPPPMTPPDSGFATGVWGPNGDQLLAGWLPVSPAVDADFALFVDAAGDNNSTSLEALSIRALGQKAAKSPPFAGKAGLTYYVRWGAKKDGGTCVGQLFVQPASWDGIEADAPVNVGSALQIGTDQTLGTTYPSTPYEGTFTMPAGATQFTFTAVGKNTAPAGGVQNVFFSYPSFKSQEVTNSIGPGAVLDGNLGTLTNPTKAQWDIQTNPLHFFDNAGHYIGQLIYDSASDTMRFLSANATFNTDLQVGALLARLTFTDDPALPAVYQFNSTLSVILATAALTTIAADGFLYLGSMPGPPTGTPTTRTGTIPLVTDSTDNVAYIYMNGRWMMIDGHTSPIVATTTFTASNVENTLYTGTITANMLIAARTVKCRLFGRINNAATGDTTTIRVKVAGTTFFTINVATINGANSPWEIELVFTTRTGGALGTLWGYVKSDFNGVLGRQTSTATFGVSTVAACNITVTEQFSTNNASDTISVDQAFIEFVN